MDGTSPPAVANIQVDITRVNDAPVLVGTNPRFDDITEDDIDNGGELISDLLAKIGDPIIDPDGPNAVEGLSLIHISEPTRPRLISYAVF